MERGPDTRAHQASIGRLTYTDLSRVDGFFASREPDAWGALRAPFSPHIARMSAELAANGYDLDVKPWIAAGWEDSTFIVEDRIVVLDSGEDSRLAAIEDEWKRHRARTLIRGVSPVGDLFRAIRQLMVTDLSKCIVMTHPSDDGRAVVAISFIGTTQKYFDWFTNFKMQRNTGMHHGFIALARKFSAQAPRILLPGLARMLGQDTCTLADALLEAERPDGRVVLWISGHSQGGALVQTYSHLLLEQGIGEAAIRAYSFAAPTVAAVDAVPDPKAYPIYNIINTDDLVPRIGAQVRLGVDWIYRPTLAFRARHYGVEEEQKAAVERSLYIGRQVQTTVDALTWLLALTRLMGDPEADIGALYAEVIPRASLLQRINVSVEEVASFMEGKLIAQHRELTGELPNEGRCAFYREAIESMMREFGPKAASKALFKSLGAPHRLRAHRGEEGVESPYIAIVRRHLSHCEQGVWLPGEPPRCVSSTGRQLLPLRTVRFDALPAHDGVPLGLLTEGAKEEDKDAEDV